MCMFTWSKSNHENVIADMQDPVDTRKSGKGSLIKDINRHAEVVMGGTPASLPADAADAAATLAASAPVSSRILAAG